MSRRVAARIYISLPRHILGTLLDGLAHHYEDVVIHAEADGTLVVEVEQ